MDINQIDFCLRNVISDSISCENEQDFLSINPENKNICLDYDIKSIIFEKGAYEKDFCREFFFNYKQIFNTDKGTNATDMEGKSKQKTIFMIEKTPLLEKEINLLIEKMNIANDMKTLFFLSTDNTCDEIKLIRNQIRIKSKRRKKKSKKEKKKKNDFKLGRKIKEDITCRNHNRFSPDNLIKSIKTKINDSLILFINKLINYIYNYEKINGILSELNLPKSKNKNSMREVIKKNEYNYRANNTNKQYNLYFLNLTLKEYFSNRISDKYLNFPFNNNKLIIEKLLQDEENKDIFNFIFNLKVEDYINIFLYKREIEFYVKDNSVKNEQINVIKDNLIRIDDYLLEIYEDNKIYFHCFLLLIYNFKAYFLSREGRDKKRNRKTNYLLGIK